MFLLCSHLKGHHNSRLLSLSLTATATVQMPRAVASFQKAGFQVEHWPVYDDDVSEPSLAPSAIHEWVGLITYRLFGRT